MNLETCKVEVHAQNLESDESNILIISMLFPDKCVKLANKKGGKVVDPNFLADISARYGEIAPIPKFAHDFIEKYQDRIVYGTDMSFGERTYKITFRILETADEHFYEIDKFNYHWPLYGLALSNKTLKKLYRDNAIKIINR